MIAFLALANGIDALAMQGAVMSVLWINSVNIDVNKRVRAVFELASLTMVAILASAASCSAPTIPIAIIPAVV